MFIMPPYYHDCVCPANNNKSVFFFIGFLGLGAVLLTYALRSVVPHQGPVPEGQEQRRIKLLEEQVDRAFNAVMAMVVLVMATALTALVSHGVPMVSDRAEL